MHRVRQVRSSTPLGGSPDDASRILGLGSAGPSDLDQAINKASQKARET